MTNSQESLLGVQPVALAMNAQLFRHLYFMFTSETSSRQGRQQSSGLRVLQP
jgi:hypothetical protein